MKTYIVSVAIAFALFSCNGHKQTETTTANNAETVEATDSHNAQNSLDYQGVYEGTVPAADCPGIQNTLTLNKDNTFTLHNKYLERKVSYDDKGTYSVDGNILTLKTDQGATFYYKIEEGQARMLDAEKQPITGELADHYILKQTKVF